MKQFHFFLLITTIFCARENEKAMNFPKPSKLTTAFSDQSLNRPQFHFTPEFGWMNDPNGLWKDGETYHLYYQYNPSDTVWSLPLYWGHATSEDLITWNHVTSNPLPIGPVKVDENEYQTGEDGISVVDPESGAYSGSIFIDDNDQSGWFNGISGSKRIIAAWTYNYPNCEKQWLSYSDDGNIFYNPVNDGKPANPMVEVNDSTLHFRDPQVIKLYDKDSKGDNIYIMTVAKPQEYKIYFYASTELNAMSKWDKQIDLELEGFLGYQYECPNLIHLYNENTGGDNFVEEYKESYWVLFISINPGSINGGSSTWYLIGQFATNDDGKYEFKPTYHYPAPLDYGKDFYAMQIMYNSGEPVNKETGYIGDGYKSYIGIAWASNWQYTGVVPTDPWRSSMSLAREVSLGFFQSSPERKILYIKSKPIIPDGYFTCTSASNLVTMYSEGDSKEYEIPDPNGSFQFQIVYTVNTSNFSNINPGHLDIKFICKDTSEYLLIGYENEATAFYVDRSHSNVEFVHNNPYFSDKISVNLQPLSSNDDEKTKTFKVNGFVDRNIIELFFNDGYQTMTNTFFFTGGNFFNSINVSADYGTKGYSITEFQFCPFTKKES